MKKLLLASTVTILALTSVVSVPKVQAANIAQSVCEYVAADDKKRMRSFLKTNKLKIRNIFSGIQCNGQNLLEFAKYFSMNKVKCYIHQLLKNLAPILF